MTPTYDPRRYQIPAGVLIPIHKAGAVVALWNLDRVRSEIRGLDPEVDSFLMALTECAQFYAARSQRGTNSSQNREPTSSLNQTITTTVAAEQLGITRRAIVKAINENRLVATRTAGGRYSITRAALQRYTPRRSPR